MNKWLLILVAGIVVMLAGCNIGKEPVIEPDWYSCSMWTICDIPVKQVYNVSSSDCIAVDSETAKWMWDLMRKYGIQASADCAQKGLVIRQVPLG